MSLSNGRALALFAIILSGFVMTLNFIFVPMIINKMIDIKTKVDRGMSNFKILTDRAWSDMMMARGGRYGRQVNGVPFPFGFQPPAQGQGLVQGNQPIQSQPPAASLGGKNLPLPSLSRDAKATQGPLPPSLAHLEPRVPDSLITPSPSFGPPASSFGPPGQSFSSPPQSFGPPGQSFSPQGQSFGPPAGGPIEDYSQLINRNCPAGLPGDPGLPGRNGTDGEPGIPGKEGMNGHEFANEINFDENNCIVCPQGPPGIKGLLGPQGAPGEKGWAGVDGNPGTDGWPGPQGPTGFQGEAGITGKPGGKGIPGKPAPGGKGEPGPKGAAGPIGRSGLQGKGGVPGLKPGPLGPIGPPGETGKDGQNGTDGASGDPGEIGVKGGDAKYCPCPKEILRGRRHIKTFY